MEYNIIWNIMEFIAIQNAAMELWECVCGTEEQTQRYSTTKPHPHAFGFLRQELSKWPRLVLYLWYSYLSLPSTWDHRYMGTMPGYELLVIIKIKCFHSTSRKWEFKKITASILACLHITYIINVLIIIINKEMCLIQVLQFQLKKSKNT